MRNIQNEYQRTGKIGQINRKRMSEVDRMKEKLIKRKRSEGQVSPFDNFVINCLSLFCYHLICPLPSRITGIAKIARIPQSTRGTSGSREV